MPDHVTQLRQEVQRNCDSAADEHARCLAAPETAAEAIAELVPSSCEV